MEHVAEITFRARQLGPLRPLAPEQIARLQAVGRGLGLPDRKILDGTPCDHCNACSAGKGGPGAHVKLGTKPAAPAPPPRAEPAQDLDDLVRRVSATVGRALDGHGK
jgi:hypothetical protein